MGLYEVIGDISNANSQKTPTGDVRMHGVVIGIVAQNYDEKMPGRVCVTIPTRGDNAKGDVLQWAKVAMPYAGKDWGFYFQPEVGDEVLLVFEQGNIEKAFVIGVIPRNAGDEKSNLVKDCFNEKNTKKRIQTKHGSKIEFIDSAEDTNGKKDVIRVSTPDNEHYMEMDNEKDSIIVSDKEKKNMIQILTHETGKISCKCEKKFEIHVGDGIQIIANGETGAVTIKAKSVNIEATDDKVSIKANSALNMEGGPMATLKANSITIEGQSSLSYKGAVIKMGQ